jgi:hypothetical protein
MDHRSSALIEGCMYSNAIPCGTGMRWVPLPVSKIATLDPSLVLPYFSRMTLLLAGSYMRK